MASRLPFSPSSSQMPSRPQPSLHHEDERAPSCSPCSHHTQHPQLILWNPAAQLPCWLSPVDTFSLGCCLSLSWLKLWSQNTSLPFLMTSDFQHLSSPPRMPSFHLSNRQMSCLFFMSLPKCRFFDKSLLDSHAECGSFFPVFPMHFSHTSINIKIPLYFWLCRWLFSQWSPRFCNEELCIFTSWLLG